MLRFFFFCKDSRDNRLHRTIIIINRTMHTLQGSKWTGFSEWPPDGDTVWSKNQGSFALTVLSLYAQTLNVRNYTIIPQENNL